MSHALSCSHIMRMPTMHPPTQPPSLHGHCTAGHLGPCWHALTAPSHPHAGTPSPHSLNWQFAHSLATSRTPTLYLRVVSLDLDVGWMVWHLSFTACACRHINTGYCTDVTKWCFVRLGYFPAAMHAMGSSRSQPMAATVTRCNPWQWFSQCNSNHRYSRPVQAKPYTHSRDDVLIVIYSKFEAICCSFIFS